MGRQGDGEMGRWGDGEMGRWGESQKSFLNIHPFASVIKSVIKSVAELPSGFYIISLISSAY